MKKLAILILLAINLFSYDFVLLNKTDIDDETIIDRITSQIENYYQSEDTQINFNLLDNKDEVLDVLQDYDFSGDEKEQKALLNKYQDLEDDLKTVFSTKYILIVDEKVNDENRNELNVVLKVNNMTYFDSTYLMPLLDNKEEVYSDTVTNVVLTYILYKDKNFINIHQL